MADNASAGMTTAKPIPAQPQKSSSMNIGRDSPVGGVTDQVAIEQRTVEALCGRFFEDRPRKLLPLVVFGGDRSDDLFGELMRPPGQVVLRCGGGEVEGHSEWGTH